MLSDNKIDIAQRKAQAYRNAKARAYDADNADTGLVYMIDSQARQIEPHHANRMEPTRQAIAYNKTTGKWEYAASNLNEKVTLRSNLVKQVTTDTRIRRERLARHERTARGQW